MFIIIISWYISISKQNYIYIYTHTYVHITYYTFILNVKMLLYK